MTDTELKAEIVKIRNALIERLKNANDDVEKASSNLQKAVDEYSAVHDEARKNNQFVPSDRHDALRQNIIDAREALTNALLTRNEIANEHSEYFRPL